MSFKVTNWRQKKVLSHLIKNRIVSVKTRIIQNHKTMNFNKLIFDWSTFVDIKWLSFHRCDRAEKGCPLLQLPGKLYPL
jgi:hypothetical protein